MSTLTSCYAMVDCNSFFASCERIFRPDLKNKPIIVLSNNDGCVIARSSEVKALGVKMGMPFFKAKNDIKKYGIEVFSSNYALYGDISNRVMSTLEELAPQIEIYSVDEAFLDLSGFEKTHKLEEFGQFIKQRVNQWVGMPVCVGIAPTKTLSKLANHGAKHYPKTAGVVNLMSKSRQDKLLAITPINDIWGVGRNLTKRLNRQGIHTALELRDSPIKQLRKQYSVVLESTIRELRGEACIDLERVSSTKKSIICSRSFSKGVINIEELKTAVASHVVRAGEKLRKENLSTLSINIFFRTNNFSKNIQQYNPSIVQYFPAPTADTRDLLNAASQLVDQAWRNGYQFKKAGVVLCDLIPNNSLQLDILSPSQSPKSMSLMKTMDSINRTNPCSIMFGINQIKKGQTNWILNRNYLSPFYTTNWNDLPKVSS